MLELCKELGIEPLVTMSHYEFPYNLTKKWNGWQDRRTIDCFVKYTTTIMNEYKDLVKYWLTFNEINTPLMGGGVTMSLGMMPENENLCSNSTTIYTTFYILNILFCGKNCHDFFGVPGMDLSIYLS